MAMSAEFTLGFNVSPTDVDRFWNDAFSRESGVFCPQYVDPWDLVSGSAQIAPDEQFIADGSLTVSDRPMLSWSDIACDGRILRATPKGMKARVALQGESIWGSGATERALRSGIQGQTAREWLTTLYVAVKGEGPYYFHLTFILSSQLWLHNPLLFHTLISPVVRTSAWLRLVAIVRRLCDGYGCTFTDIEMEGIVGDWGGATLFHWLSVHPSFRAGVEFLP